MQNVCHGAPNLYFLFWAMGIQNLKPNCELVYIIPRSWTSGAYFESFRKFLFDNCVITDIHLFGSRDKVFDKESVLQETMIIKVVKKKESPSKIKITSSLTSDFSNIVCFDADYNVVVSDNQYVYLVTIKNEVGILSKINQQKNTLKTDNLPMKTGIVVDFRSTELLRDKEGEETFPLFYSQNIKNGKVIWPVGKKKEFICTDRMSYLQENCNYLFVKRFTSKEKKRRLQCGIYLSEEYPQYKYISTQNKVNYIKCDSVAEAYGLYVILNSSIYDSYYRILNGSTQVNSTEINNMPVPPRNIITEMGNDMMGKDLTEDNCNRIIEKWIK